MTAPTTLETFGATYLRLQQLLADVGESQWKAGATPRPVEDTTERSKGTKSDPTPAIVLDGRRLALRAAVIEVEQALEKAGRVMQAAERHLHEKLEAHHG
ncbi:hypothetical protein SEA_FRANKLIN22_43 [Microbacterium phage Franklin22]|uniref:hypothetical protein n=1 Tax=Microbacterium phage Franklin22 TaxID=2894293 RepID=UPI001E7AB37B|nr:hypothetical protein QDW15_gp43 [Microbacterium phage Franklin22]UGL61856.1 hypothetical protein SEA_FRANKLIN22_43 [Microbacterium phage Franklin22]